MSIKSNDSALKRTEIIRIAFGNQKDVIETNHTVYVGDFQFTNVLNGKGMAYYPSGYLIQGNFTDSVPDGLCTILFDGGRIQEEVRFEKGMRTGTMRITYPSGIIVSGEIQDLSNNLLFTSVIPFFRNYYNTSVLMAGDPSYNFSFNIMVRSQPLVQNSLEFFAYYYFLRYFDIQQSKLVVNVCHESISHLQPLDSNKEPFQSLIADTSFNLVEKVTLVCHTLVMKSQVHYILPEVQLTKNLNSVLQTTLQNMSELSEAELRVYDQNLRIIMQILDKSTHLHTLSLVAYPYKEMKLEFSVFEHIQELEMKGWHSYHCFT